MSSCWICFMMASPKNLKARGPYKWRPHAVSSPWKSGRSWTSGKTLLINSPQQFFIFTRQKATRPLVSTETMQRWHFVSPLFSFKADYMKEKKSPMDRTNLQVMEKMLSHAKSVFSTDSLNWKWMYISFAAVSLPDLQLAHGKTTFTIFGWINLQILEQNIGLRWCK